MVSMSGLRLGVILKCIGASTCFSCSFDIVVTTSVQCMCVQCAYLPALCVHPDLSGP